MIQPAYTHPRGEVILNEVKSILSASAKGVSLLQEPAQIIILKGPLPQAFVYEDKIIYLRIPALQEKGRLEQAIDLAGAYIELKMNQKLSPLEAESLGSDDILSEQHYKNVAIIYKTFPIAAELEEQGHKAVKELRLMGLGKLYQAWKTGVTLEDCANIYWEMFETKEED